MVPVLQLSVSNVPTGYNQLATNSYEAVTASNDAQLPQRESSKRKRRDSVTHHPAAADDANASQHHASPPPKKKKRTSSTSANSNSAAKKNAVYCVCKTKFDPTK